METLWQDLKYGARQLRRNPGFTAVAVLTLALGIGANTAIFSAVNAVLLQPLPFRQPERLVFMTEKTAAGNRMSVAYPNFRDWQERSQSFSEMACFRSSSFNLTGIDQPVRLRGQMVSWNFFQLLGTTPQLGRLFTPSDDQRGTERTVIIGHGLWTERFGGDAKAIGRTVILDGDPFTVIGVLPPNFEFLRADDVYLPVGLYLTPESGMLDRGNHFSLYGLGRLKQAMGTGQAREEMERLAAQLEREYPSTNSGNGAMVQPLQEVFVEDIRTSLLVLMGAVGFVLLLACVNLANLLLARATFRRRELAIRLALGASRWAVIRQLLIEGLLTSGLGGLAGLLLAVWFTEALLALAPPGIPRLGQTALDGAVLGFALVLSVLTGILFGLMPALQASRGALHDDLKQGARTAGAGGEGTRTLLLVAEVGLALLLLSGAGLMVRSVVALVRVDPGFNAENLLTMRFILPQTDYPAAQRRLFYRECLSRVSALPGVRAAGLTLSLPIEGSNWGSVFIVGDQPVPERAQLPSAAFNPVSPGYFETMQIRLLKGRTFTQADNEQGVTVTVINETLAKRFWPNQDPIGKRLKQGWPENPNPWREVVGVVADVKLNGVDQATPMQAYLPLEQEPARSLALVVRTTGKPLQLGSAAEQAIHSIDRNLPVFSIRSLDQVFGSSIQRQRLLMTLLSGISGLALILAAIGIYGVIAYNVAHRTQEIGVRMALGAQQKDVLRLILKQGLKVTLAGAVLGLIGAFTLTRWLEALLFRIEPTDGITLVAVTLLVVGVALIACWVPARRAMRVDPMTALRYE